MSLFTIPPDTAPAITSYAGLGLLYVITQEEGLTDEQMDAVLLRLNGLFLKTDRLSVLVAHIREYCREERDRIDEH